MKIKLKEPFTKEFIIGIIILFLLIVFAGYSIPKIMQSASAPAGQFVRPTVIVDPGHGGVDGGAVCVDGTEEKEINLEISLKLRDFLRSAGYKVILTRETDISIHDDSAKTIRQKKVSDLHNRLKIANDNPDGIFVSIHQNKFEQAKYSGAQIFYSKNNEKSLELAQCVDQKIKEETQPDNTRELKRGGKNLFLLWNAQIPAVLVECGFLSNPKESELLKTSDYQKELAFAIFCGIENYGKGSTGELSQENSSG